MMASFARPSSAVVLLLLSACASVEVNPEGFDVEPGARPSLESDEAGLWMQMDRVEQDLKTAANVVEDPALNEYVGAIVCRLHPAYCQDLRVYVVRVPYFNATMAPNGVLQVWTGLLLRAANEDQLAYVLGHEMAHYLEKHSVERWRDLRRKTDLSAVFELMTALAGVGYVGSVARLATVASALSYSREQEREADAIGLELMASAGYEPREGAALWEALIRERSAAEDPDTLIFFSTHPAIEERIESLRLAAAEVAVATPPSADGARTFEAVIGPHRATWLRDELRLRHYAQTEVVLEHLRAQASAPGQIAFFTGEFYRLRAEEGDEARAIAAYRHALQLGDQPPEIHRSLAQVHLQRGDKAAAKREYRRYLVAAPDALDRMMIEQQIALLQGA